MRKSSILIVITLIFLLSGAVYGGGFDKKVYAERRANIYQRLEANSILILFGNDVTRGGYFQNSEFIYLTGVEAPGSIFVGLKNSNREYLFLPPWSDAYNVWDDEIMSPGKKAQEKTGIRNTLDNTGFYNRAFSMLARVEILYMNLDSAPGLEGPVSKRRVFIKKVRENFPNLKIKNVTSMVNEMQGVKGPEEIEKLKKAIGICGKAVMEGIKYAEPEMWEYQIQALVDFIFINEGGQRTLFNIVGSGPNSCILHHMSNDRQMKSGDLVVLDVGVSYDYYGSDITRTFPVSGKYTDEQKKIYSIVLEANKKAIAAAKPGITIGELQRIATKVISDAGYRKYFIHGLSHHINGGAGGYTTPLKPGMLITIEPGIYIMEKELGVRIEDDILITETGCINLTEFVPKEVDDIEKLCREGSKFK